VGTKAPAADEGWQPVAKWPQPNLGREVKLDHALAITALGAVEGEKVEIALRGRDADPAKGSAWTAGETFNIAHRRRGHRIPGALRADLAVGGGYQKLISVQQEGVTHAAEWIQKFDPASGLRWDDQKTLAALAAAMREQAKAQEQLRQTAGTVARDLVTAAGNLRFSLGMLTDTEMVRAIRVLEGVQSKDDSAGQARRAGGGALHAGRTIRSLNEILGSMCSSGRTGSWRT